MKGSAFWVQGQGVFGGFVVPGLGCFSSFEVGVSRYDERWDTGKTMRFDEVTKHTQDWSGISIGNRNFTKTSFKVQLRFA